MNHLTPKKSAFLLRQSGLSIVELLVAISISLLLLTGVIQIFSSSSQIYRVNQGLSQIQENARFAIEFLSRDLRLADFWGCTQSIDGITNNLPFTAENGVIDANLNFDAGGLNGTESTGLNQSDGILVRGAFGTGLVTQPPFTNLSAVTTITNNGLNENDNILVSDCTQGDIFQITNATAGTSGLLSSNSNLSKIYQADAQIFPVRTINYSIAMGLAGQPALFRNNLELVDGINSLQVLYGEDTNGNETPNYYVTANNVVNMDNVISLRISILVQSYNDFLTSTPQNYNFNGVATVAADNRLYRVFTTTITLRNRIS
ncbi:MAG: pilus assembly protein PilW [Gammaproteobacteria bacterium]|nr:pilus assembly protein PilW [Gammaproteobacteria bacterium]